MLRIIFSSLWIICWLGGWGLSTQVGAEEEMYLEGISVVGKEKSAYLSLTGEKFQVHEGETVGDWKVAKIEQHSIFFTTEQGKTTELRLYNRLPLSKKSATGEGATEPGVIENSPDVKIDEDETAATTNDQTSSIEREQVEKTKTTSPSESTETVPPGYRKVHTPFGDFVVKAGEADKINATTSSAEDKTISPSLPNSETIPHSASAKAPSTTTSPANSSEDTTEDTTEEPIPPGYRRMQTPFGSFLVEDKPKTDK